MKMSSIVVFTTAYAPFVGGAEIAVQEIARHMRGDFRFIIITARFRRDLPRYELRDGVEIYRIGWGSALDKWLLVFAGILGVSRITKKNNPVFAVFGLDLSQGSLAAAFFKFFHPSIPFIFNIQYGYGEERIQNGRVGFIRYAFRFILRMADNVTAISTYLGDLVRSYGYGGPIEIIPNGIDFAKFENNAPHALQKEKIVITTSRLVSKNGIDILIDAMVEVRKHIPEVTCHILGDGPERAALEARAREKNVTDIVTFFGNVPHEQLPRRLHESDVFVRPSRSEGMGNSFVEALAAGLPVIGTAVGGIPDIIKDGDTGFLIVPNNVHACAEKIIAVLQDPMRAAMTVARGQEYIRERFSWNTIVEQYRVLFAKMKNKQLLRIVMATPIFPPQLGGPARYAHHLSEEFRKMGHYVSVVSFGGFLRLPSGIRHIAYAWSLFHRSLRADVMLSLDYVSVGLPAVFISRLMRVPLVVRVEGDFLWESFVERTRTDITLREFYATMPPLSLKEWVINAIQQFTLRRCSYAVFSSEWRRKIICDVFHISSENTTLIQNVWNSATLMESSTREPIILWAGRMLYLKNLERLIRTFSRIGHGEYELHIVGDGPERTRIQKYIAREKIKKVRIISAVDEKTLRTYIRRCAFFVLPSLSDVGPNVIADAVSTRTPFLMTRESGFYEYLKDVGVFCDPLNERDIEEKLRLLMDPVKRVEYEEKLANIKLQQNWEQAARQWVDVLGATK